MIKFYKSLLSLVLSGCLVISSLTPAWASLSSSDRTAMQQTVTQLIAAMQADDEAIIPSNARCDDLWEHNKASLGDQDEGMFKAYCASWLEQVQKELCSKKLEGECQRAQDETVIIDFYKQQRSRQEQYLEEALNEQGNLLENLISFLGKDEEATCREIYAQCEAKMKNEVGMASRYTCSSDSVYGDILPRFIQTGGYGISNESLEILKRNLRNKVIKNNDKACYNNKKWNDFEKERLSYVSLLGLIGSTAEDANALKSYYIQKDDKEGGPTPDLLFLIADDIMLMEQWDVLKALLNSSFGKSRKCPTDWGLGISDIIKGIRYISHPANSEFACGWENSWFKAEGFQNGQNAWAQLGQQIGYLAAQGNAGAKTLLSGINYSGNKMFELGVIVSGQHPTYNKSNRAKTAKYVEDTALNLMVNLDPFTKAYVRDGLYTIYTQIAGKSADEAKQVALYDQTNLANAFSGLTALNIAVEEAVYAAYRGIYPANSAGSNALVDAENIQDTVWQGLEELGNWADWILIIEGGYKIFGTVIYGIVKGLEGVASAAGRFWKVASLSRKSMGFSIGRAAATGGKAVTRLGALKLTAAWKNLSFSVSRLVYGSDHVKTLSRQIEALKAQYNVSRTAQELEKGHHILKALKGKYNLGPNSTPAQIKYAIKNIQDPSIAQDLQDMVTLLEDLGISQEAMKTMSYADILEGIKQGKLPELQKGAVNIKGAKPGESAKPGKGAKPREGRRC